MQHSTDRILTTHAGSLPRPPELTRLFMRRSRGETVDEDALAATGREAVSWVVAKQREVGIDIISNGEQQRESFVLYLRRRLSGIGGKRGRNHVLAEPPVSKSRTGALAADILAASGDFGTIILRARDLRQHPPRFDGKDLDLAVTKVVFAAREYLIARGSSQGIDIETGSVLRFHARGFRMGSGLRLVGGCHWRKSGFFGVLTRSRRANT